MTLPLWIIFTAVILLEVLAPCLSFVWLYRVERRRG